jgi:hypothetical protein
MGDHKIAYKVLVRKPTGKRKYLGDLGIDGRLILKYNLKT